MDASAQHLGAVLGSGHGPLLPHISHHAQLSARCAGAHHRARMHQALPAVQRLHAAKVGHGRSALSRLSFHSSWFDQLDVRTCSLLWIRLPVFELSHSADPASVTLRIRQCRILLRLPYRFHAGPTLYIYFAATNDALVLCRTAHANRTQPGVPCSLSDSTQ